MSSTTILLMCRKARISVDLVAGRQGRGPEEDEKGLNSF